MSLADLKLELIKDIIETNDVELLMKLKKVFEDSINEDLLVDEPATVYKNKADTSNSKNEDVYIFNEWEEEKINRALKQYENGECISDEEAQKEIQAWLED